jgi:hypothetical protein
MDDRTLAIQYTEQSDWPNAVFYSRIYHITQESPDSLYLFAQALLHSLDYTSCYQLLSLVPAHTNETGILFAKAAMKLGRDPEAEKVLVFFPDSPAAFALLADICKRYLSFIFNACRTNRHEKAVQLYKRLLDHDPNNHTAYDALIFLHHPELPRPGCNASMAALITAKSTM